MPNSRKNHRLSFTAICTLDHGGRQFAAELIDISLKGALVNMPSGWAAQTGAACRMRLQLAASVEVIDMEMEVRRSDGPRLGLLCRGIDVESLTHLRRLLELNFGDPSLVERELGLLG